MTIPRGTRSLLDRPTDGADHREAAERRRAVRALLSRPLLHGIGPQDTEQIADDLRLIRRHRDQVTKEFADGLRYRLIVEPAGARLVKTGLGRDATRPLRRPSRSGIGRPFTPRGYGLLMVTLSVLGRSRTQLLLAELIGEIRSAAAAVDMTVDLDSLVDRRALQAVLLVLTEFGVLYEREGDLEHWAENGAAQSLLDLSPERLGLLLAVPLPTHRSNEEILDPAPLASAAGGARIAVRRMLAESPVLTTAELDPEHQEWWSRTRHQQSDWCERVLGLQLELRAEGAIAVDPDDELSDERFPGPGSVRHAALLVLSRLVPAIRERTRREVVRGGWWQLTADELAAAVDGVAATYGKSLRAAYRTSPDELRRDVIDLLARMGLLRDDNGGFRLHAAAARYDVLLTVETAPADSLFDDASGAP